MDVPHTVRTCWLASAALGILVGLSFLLSRHGAGAWESAAMLAIAAAMALIIVVFFFGLGRQPGSNRLVLLVAATLILILVGFTTADVLTRS